MSCILCNRESFQALYSIEGYEIQTCRECGLTQLNPLPNAELLREIYISDYFSKDRKRQGYDDYAVQEEEYETTFEEELEILEKFVKGKRVLDIGCGFGYFLGVALKKGYDAYGIDLSKQAIEIAEKKYPGRVFKGTIDTVPEIQKSRYDIVFCSHLIEHLPDPVAFAESVACLLRPGGVCSIVTPNIGSLLSRISGRRWVSFKVPEHLSYFNFTTIKRLLETVGLNPIRVESAHQYYRLPFIAEKIRDLLHPVSLFIPRIENMPPFKNRIIRIHNGSLRAIAVKTQSSEA
ncbi:MAG: class I SAM-dependent methyltransferase [Candidatus Hydrogenedentes bacterium]|nr:class I SAM-dependent methyltransferase [Candidatus Hydrogenedentota bacterium]